LGGAGEDEPGCGVVELGAPAALAPAGTNAQQAIASAQEAVTSDSDGHVPALIDRTLSRRRTGDMSIDRRPSARIRLAAGLSR
jgi:hypothetical protein